MDGEMASEWKMNPGRIGASEPFAQGTKQKET